jgi:hypothetical protein
VGGGGGSSSGVQIVKISGIRTTKFYGYSINRGRKAKKQLQTNSFQIFS